MKKRDRIIQLIREMMVANSPGSSGGFSANPPEDMKNSVAGFDPILGIFRRTRKGKIDRRVKALYKRWIPKH